MSNLLNVFGNYSTREVKRIMPIVNKIEALDIEFGKLSDEELKNKTLEFKERLQKGETLDDILVEAFATVREASFRVLNMKHYKVQLIGGIVLHQGRITEMKTGEGKTLVATLPSYLNALEGKGVTIVTTNDYLANRDKEEMGQIHEFLGLTVDVILHDKMPEDRRKAYHADITYGTNNELGFDYLRDNMAIKKEERVQRELNYVIVDEIDSILIDEARTPLILAGEGKEADKIYGIADNFVKMLKIKEHYDIDYKVKAVTLTDAGMDFVEQQFGLDNYANKENKLIQHHVIQALKANYTMEINKEYIVRDEEILIVDSFTGRVMEGRRFSEGLHEAIEAKEGLEVQKESKTLATITLQNYFRLFKKLSGMTGTAITEDLEFREIYNLDVVSIPTNEPLIRADHGDLIYKTRKSKYAAIVKSIIDSNTIGQPVLVGTASIEKSEDISALLKRKGIKHSVLNAKNHDREAKIISKAGEKGAVTIATNMAGRGTDIKLEEGVVELGGLKVIGTDKHESRRIDNQLRGRSGRQGDPGSSQFIVSFEDDLIKHFLPERFRELYESLTAEEDLPLESKWITKALDAAQKAVEGNNFRARKDVLGYDDVINTQRKIIYLERNKVLDEEDVSQNIVAMIKDVVEKKVKDYLTTDSEEEYETELENLIVAVEGVIVPKSALSFEELNKVSEDEIKEKIFEVAYNIYLEKEKELGEAELRELERVYLLKVVDERWIDYLDDLEFLKQGIGLRAYRQMDPTLAFSIEASEMFNEMVYSIKLNTISNLFATFNINNIQ